MHEPLVPSMSVVSELDVRYPRKNVVLVKTNMIFIDFALIFH